jgi:uncharacterized protein YecE (DUF72 family)
VPQREWLPYYAARFPTVEVNNTFYRLPPPETFAAWAAATPPGFRFAIKASRYLTHIKRLGDPEEPVARLLRHARPLGSKLDVVLVQLPPNLKVDVARLARTVACFPPDARVAFEPRHETWFHDEVYALLRDAGWALCLTDRRGTIGPLVATAEWCYLRLHEGTATPRPCYGRHALASWWTRLVDLYGPDPTGYVYFNNDPGGCAVRNARTFTRRMSRVQRGVGVQRAVAG